jgi:hypothetical protein
MIRFKKEKAQKFYLLGKTQTLGGEYEKTGLI